MCQYSGWQLSQLYAHMSQWSWRQGCSLTECNNTRYKCRLWKLQRKWQSDYNTSKGPLLTYEKNVHMPESPIIPDEWMSELMNTRNVSVKHYINNESFFSLHLSYNDFPHNWYRCIVEESSGLEVNFKAWFIFRLLLPLISLTWTSTISSSIPSTHLLYPISTRLFKHVFPLINTSIQYLINLIITFWKRAFKDAVA